MGEIAETKFLYSDLDFQLYLLLLFKSLIIQAFIVFCIAWHLIYCFIFIHWIVQTCSLSKLLLIFILHESVISYYLNNTLLSAFYAPTSVFVMLYMW